MPSSKVGHVKPKIGAIAVLKDGIKTGWLHKTGFKNKGWKKRFCVLTRDTLYYFADANSGSQKGEVVLADVTDVGLTDKTGKYLKKDNVITLYTPGRPFYFAAPSVEEANLWIEKVGEFISVEKKAEGTEDKKAEGVEEKKEEVKDEEKKDEENKDEKKEEEKKEDEKKDEEKKEEEKKEEEKKDEEKKEEKKEEEHKEEVKAEEKEEVKAVEVKEEKPEENKEEVKVEETKEVEEKNDEQKEVDKKETEEKQVEEKKEEEKIEEKVAVPSEQVEVAAS